MGRALDVQRAVFFKRVALAGNVSVEHRWYAPLQHPSLLVHEMEFTSTASAKSPPATIQLASRLAAGHGPHPRRTFLHCMIGCVQAVHPHGRCSLPRIDSRLTAFAALRVARATPPCCVSGLLGCWTAGPLDCWTAGPLVVR